MPSNFDFLPATGRWEALRTVVRRAERYAAADPGSACVKARKVLEFVVGFVYEHELEQERRDTLYEDLSDPRFEVFVEARGPSLDGALHRIRMAGNDGAHLKDGGLSADDAREVLHDLHRVLRWFVFRYAPDATPEADTTFDADLYRDDREAGRSRRRKRSRDSRGEPRADRTERSSRSGGDTESAAGAAPSPSPAAEAAELRDRATGDLIRIVREGRRGDASDARLQAATAVLLRRIKQSNDELLAALAR
jgi:hypothetical protein